MPTLSTHKVGFVLLGLFLHLQGNAQHISRMRADDDFSYLSNDSLKKSWDEKWKMISLGGPVDLSIGAEWREQYQSYTNVNFGEDGSTLFITSKMNLLRVKTKTKGLK